MQQQVNYNEKVLLPFLERKAKELLSVNLVLEAKLLMEMEKNRDLESEIQTLKGKLESLKKSKKSKGEESQESTDAEVY